MVLVPIDAKLTRGRYYLARPEPDVRSRFRCDGPDGDPRLHGVDDDNELPDVVDWAHHGAAVCSLCCTLETGGEHVCQRADTEPVLLTLTARQSA